MQNNTFWIQPFSNEGNILPDLAKKLSEKTSAIKSSDFVEQSKFIRQSKAYFNPLKVDHENRT